MISKPELVTAPKKIIVWLIPQRLSAPVRRFTALAQRLFGRLPLAQWLPPVRRRACSAPATCSVAILPVPARHRACSAHLPTGACSAPRLFGALGACSAPCLLGTPKALAQRRPLAQRLPPPHRPLPSAPDSVLLPVGRVPLENQKIKANEGLGVCL